MTRKEAIEKVGKILGKTKGFPWDVAVRSRSTPSARYGVGRWHVGRIEGYRAYGATWEEAIERLRISIAEEGRGFNGRRLPPAKEIKQEVGA